MTRSRLSLVVVVLLAAALRISGLEARSYWGDEIVCLTVASGHSWYPWQGEEIALFYDADHYRGMLSLSPDYFSQRLISLLRMNDQIPPFYYVLLNLWMHLFGTSVAALRALPLLASVASVPMIYALGRALHSSRAGLYAAIIFALTPFQVAFGLYNRPYAWLCLFALGSTLAAVHLSRGAWPWRWAVLYVVFAVLGLYTHYLFVWTLVFQCVFVSWSRRHDRSALGRFAVVGLIIGAFGLPWLPAFADQIAWSRAAASQSWFYWYSGAPSLESAGTSLARTMLLLLSAGRVSGFCSPAQDGSCAADEAVTAISYLVPLIVIGFVAWVVVRRRRGREKAESLRPWMILLAWLLCVMAGPVLSDVLLDSHMVFSHRYFIVAGAPLYLLCAMSIAEIRGQVVRVAAIAMLAAFLAIGSGFHLANWTGTLLYEVPSREIAARIDAASSPDGDLVLVLDPGLNPTDFAMYLQSNPDFARVDVPARHTWASPVSDQLQRIIEHQPWMRVWYLDDHGPERKAHAEVVEWLRAHYARSAVVNVRNVDIYRFSVPVTAGVDALAGVEARSESGHASTPR
jgi:uncharacterized membrane protein